MKSWCDLNLSLSTRIISILSFNCVISITLVFLMVDVSTESIETFLPSPRASISTIFRKNASGNAKRKKKRKNHVSYVSHLDRKYLPVRTSPIVRHSPRFIESNRTEPNDHRFQIKLLLHYTRNAISYVDRCSISTISFHVELPDFCGSVLSGKKLLPTPLISLSVPLFLVRFAVDTRGR